MSVAWEEAEMSLNRIRARLWGGLVAMLLVIGFGIVFASPAHADLLLTFGGATGYRASITVQSVDSDTLRFIVQNTTAAGATTGSASRILLLPADCPLNVTSGIDANCRLLASFGWDSTALSVGITGGSALIPTGSSGAGKVGPTSYSWPAGTDWSAEWGYANNAAPNTIGTYDFLSTNEANATNLCASVGAPSAATCGNRDKQEDLDGPQGGILSSFWTSSNGLGYVRDTLEVTVNFSGNLPGDWESLLGDATWFVEFGSGTVGITNGTTEEAAEPSAVFLLVCGVAGILWSRRLAPQMHVS